MKKLKSRYRESWNVRTKNGRRTHHKKQESWWAKLKNITKKQDKNTEVIAQKAVQAAKIGNKADKEREKLEYEIAKKQRENQLLETEEEKVKLEASITEKEQDIFKSRLSAKQKMAEYRKLQESRRRAGSEEFFRFTSDSQKLIDTLTPKGPTPKQIKEAAKELEEESKKS